MDRSLDPKAPLAHRGAVGNPTGRYEPYAREGRRDGFDDGWTDALAFEDLPPLKTEVTVEAPKTVLTRNGAPDLPFEVSINPYRGCEHGCVYCYARPTHARFGYSPGLDFESRLTAKPDAPALLEKALSNPRYRVAPIALGTNTDPYQPIEREWRIMRGIVEVLHAHRHPLMIVTKSGMIRRDLDLLADMAADGLVRVGLSLTTLDRDLARTLEPRATPPAGRLAAIRALAEAGVPVTAMIAPVVPGLTDHELERLMDAAAEAGASACQYIFLRLPDEVEGLFVEWLEAHAPLKAAKVLSLIRQGRAGALDDKRAGRRFTGQGPIARLISERFHKRARRLGLTAGEREVSLDCAKFRRPPKPGDQLGLF